MLEHEVHAIVENLARDLAPMIADRLDGTLRAIIRKELQAMIDPLAQSIDDLTAATSAELSLISDLLSAVNDSASNLPAAAASGDAAAVEVQVKRVTDGIAAARTALAALQGSSPAPVAPGAPASPAPVAPDPVAAPAAAPAQTA